MASYKIQDGVLKSAEDKDILTAFLSSDIKCVSEDAFSGCSSLCAADVYSEESAYIPAALLIFHDGVKKLSGTKNTAEIPLSFACEYFHERTIDGAPRISPVVVIPESVTEIEGYAIPSGTTVIAGEGSAGERYAKEVGRLCSTDLSAAVNKLLREVERTAEAAKKRSRVFAGDLKRAEEKYGRLLAAEEGRLAEERDRIEGEIEKLSEELVEVKRQAEELTQQIKEAEQELKSTFVLNKRRRDELSTEIEELTHRQTAAQLRANTLPVKIHALEVELESPLANMAIQREKERCEKLSGGVKHFDKVSERLEICLETLRLRINEMECSKQA